MTVESFDPNAIGRPMDEAAVRDLCAYAAALGGDRTIDKLTLSELEVARFTVLAKHPEWSVKAREIDSERTLAGLIRVFTLGEMQYPGWAAGDKSPVVALVKELKRRDAYDPSITRWIKDNTTNRFLPHGSLMDRL